MLFSLIAIKGWYDNAEFKGEPITSITIGESGNKHYYAKWEPREDVTYKVLLFHLLIVHNYFLPIHIECYFLLLQYCYSKLHLYLQILGLNYFLAIDENGNIWGVGDNSQGQLGDGTLENKTELTQICLYVYWSIFIFSASIS